MQGDCSALAPLSNEHSCETGSFSCLHNPYSILPLEVPSLHFQMSQPLLTCGVCCLIRQAAHLSPPTCLNECFFKSLAVGVPCSLLFWQFLLFIVFKLVVILLLVVRWSEVFLPTLPFWLKPQNYTFFYPKEQAFGFVEFLCCFSMFSVALIFTLIFIISFLLFSLGLLCSSFSSFLRWKWKSLVWVLNIKIAAYNCGFVCFSMQLYQFLLCVFWKFIIRYIHI